MSVANPNYMIERQSVIGMEGMWCKMFDPPTASPATPDLVAPTNPVPDVMLAAGIKNKVSIPNTEERDLMHGEKIPTWDGAFDMEFMLIRDGDNPFAVGTYPGPIVRVPRGVVFHANTKGHGPPPHTIHWHGIEPTPMNDGVGHCSMEIGDYIYQWQPNFIGHYFYHCHRNTPQHFEFGLYSVLFVETPDAYFATLWNPAIPIGAGRDGLRRIATNLDALAAGIGIPKDVNGNPLPNLLPVFPGFNNNLLTDPDPEAANPNLPATLKFATDPHAMTVPYDVEVLWAPDDRDSFWSENAKNARATYPRHGDIPGFNDNFAGNAGGGVGADDFFAFNDFRPDYFYVTGVPVPAPLGGVGTLPTGAAIPAAINSGVAGTQVSVHAELGQTILLRCIDGAYACVEYILPVDAVVISWDGRSLGVPPYTQYNHPYLVPAGTPIHASVARRVDMLIKSDVPVNAFGIIRFIDTRGQVPGQAPTVLMTAQIPFNIGTTPVASTFSISGTITDTNAAPMGGVEVTIASHSLGGSPIQKLTTDPAGNFIALGLTNGMYQIMPEAVNAVFDPAATDVNVNDANITGVNFVGTVTMLPNVSIFGRVTSLNGRGLAGVTVALSGTAARSRVTDRFGNFNIVGLSNGDYVVTPILAGLTFTPASRNVTIAGATPAAQTFVAAQLATGNVTVTKVTVTGSNSPKGPSWVLQGMGTAGATISIYIGAVSGGQLLGTAIVARNGKWAFNKRVLVGRDVGTIASLSVASSDGGVAPDISMLDITRAEASTRGAAAITLGPLWILQGKDMPGAVVTLRLGPNPDGALIGTVTANQAGVWRFSKRVLVATAASVIATSSTGGSATKPLTVK